jgi:hypothetical protein
LWSLGTTVKFNLLNLVKPDSLHSEGMQPCVFSRTSHWLKGIRWHRAGKKINYYLNEKMPRRDIQWKLTPKWASYYYTFSFEYTFEHDEDIVSFSHSVPYTYSRQCWVLDQIGNEKQYQNFLRINTMCYTLASKIWKLMIQKMNARCLLLLKMWNLQWDILTNLNFQKSLPLQENSSN